MTDSRTQEDVLELLWKIYEVGCGLPPERWSDETYSQAEARDLDKAITKIIEMCDDMRLVNPEIETFFSGKRIASDAIE